MTLPRELSLATVDGVPRLLQTVPAEAPTALAAAGPSFTEDAVDRSPTAAASWTTTASGTALDHQRDPGPG